MNFLIIIPAHNEEAFIAYCLKSLQRQRYRDFRAVIVNDGSTDGTRDVCDDFLNNHNDSRFTILNLQRSQHQPGAKVVRSFNAGLETQNLQHFDIICKFDADIIFPENYLEELAKVYAENPRAGMVSGLVKISSKKPIAEDAFDFSDSDEVWKFENISSKNHVRGPVKSYRRGCFEKIGGLRPVLGWDNIDVMLSEISGYEVVTIKNLWVKHLRPTAFKYQGQRAEKLGEYFYNIGLDLPLTILSAAKEARKGGGVQIFFIILKSYLRQRGRRVLTKHEIREVRKLRWKKILVR